MIDPVPNDQSLLIDTSASDDPNLDVSPVSPLATDPWRLASKLSCCPICGGTNTGCKIKNEQCACRIVRSSQFRQHVGHDGAKYSYSLCVPEILRIFITMMYGYNDVILFRQIETWQGAINNGDKVSKQKQNRYIDKATRYVKTSHFILSNLAWRMSCECAETERANQFFGVCPRYRAATEMSGKRVSFDRASQIRNVPVLWVDVDHCTIEEFMCRCKASGLPLPTIVVNSGHGVHAYWVLDVPYMIDDVGPPLPVFWEKNTQGKRMPYTIMENGEFRPGIDEVSAQGRRIQAILKGISAKIGGDHATDLSRILRLPCTFNRKNERNGTTPIPCTLEHCDPSLSYPLKDFHALAIDETRKPYSVTAGGRCRLRVAATAV